MWNVTGNRPSLIRLKGYRSYQTNDSVMKYFNDGIIGVITSTWKVKESDLNAYSKEIFTSQWLFPKTKSEHSCGQLDKEGTFRPWPEEKTFIGAISKEISAERFTGFSTRPLNQQTIGGIQTDSSPEHLSDARNQTSYLLPRIWRTSTSAPHAQISRPCGGNLSDEVPEDYYSAQGPALPAKSDSSYLSLSQERASSSKLIHVAITEPYITERYEKANHQTSSSPKESAAAITDFTSEPKTASLAWNNQDAQEYVQLKLPYNLQTWKREIKGVRAKILLLMEIALLGFLQNRSICVSENLAHRFPTFFGIKTWSSSPRLHFFYDINEISDILSLSESIKSVTSFILWTRNRKFMVDRNVDQGYLHSIIAHVLPFPSLRYHLAQAAWQWWQVFLCFLQESNAPQQRKNSAKPMLPASPFQTG